MGVLLWVLITQRVSGSARCDLEHWEGDEPQFISEILMLRISLLSPPSVRPPGGSEEAAVGLVGRRPRGACFCSPAGADMPGQAVAVIVPDRIKTEMRVAEEHAGASLLPRQILLAEPPI